MNKKVKKHLFNVLFVLLLLGITMFILLKSNDELSWTDVKEFFSGCNVWYIVAAIGGMFVFLLAEAFSLKNIARKFGYKTKFVSAFAYSAADAYYSALTPSATGGQPASAYYMIKDGIDGGTTTFVLVFNLLGYTAAIFVLGISAFIISLFTSGGTWAFIEFSTLSKVLIIIGAVMQAFLIWLFIACLRHPNAVLKTGNFFIKILAKLHLSKKPDILREKLAGMVEKYRHCGAEIKKHKWLFFQTLVWNVIQRGAQVAITAFVFKAAQPQTDMLHVFALQCFVLLGYNSIPLPGGSGVFELLYMNVFSTVAFFDKPFLVVAVMVTRVISYYGCLIFSGACTLIYHVVQNNKTGTKEKLAEVIEEIGDIRPVYDPNFKESIALAERKMDEKNEQMSEETGEEETNKKGIGEEKTTGSEENNEV